MADENSTSFLIQLARWLATVTPSTWGKVLGELWQTGQKLWRDLGDKGLYEVLEYTSTLELLDKRGKQAFVRKYEKVRYLQNNIIAYQDKAWGDGEILIDYRCSPGIPVDHYRPGRKTYILISLREARNQGEVDEFNIEWGMRKGFLRPSELWEVQINHRTKQAKLQVIFPATRPPLRVSLIEGHSQCPRPLGNEAQHQLPDGRWMVAWETTRPRLHETYSLKWDW
jgi:hypothetical protein